MNLLVSAKVGAHTRDKETDRRDRIGKMKNERITKLRSSSRARVAVMLPVCTMYDHLLVSANAKVGAYTRDK